MKSNVCRVEKCNDFTSVPSTVSADFNGDGEMRLLDSTILAQRLGFLKKRDN